MITEEKCLIVDLDGTLCPEKQPDQEYAELPVYEPMRQKLLAYQAEGYTIIIQTARTMRTHGGNVGRITAKTAKITIDWLDRHGIPYDELHFGKPWNGRGGFYIDDNAIRPREFLELTPAEIQARLKADKDLSGYKPDRMAS